MSPEDPEAPTLVIDCGGGGIKGTVLDESGTMRAQPIRVPTPYPLSTDLFVSTLAELAGRLPHAMRATVGMPGMIRHGVVVSTPHYVTVRGPRTRVDPVLLAQWNGFDAREALREALGIPVLVLNDAEVHGAGVVAGKGLELVAAGHPHDLGDQAPAAAGQDNGPDGGRIDPLEQAAQGRPGRFQRPPARPDRRHGQDVVVHDRQADDVDGGQEDPPPQQPA